MKPTKDQLKHLKLIIKHYSDDDFTKDCYYNSKCRAMSFNPIALKKRYLELIDIVNKYSSDRQLELF